MRRADLIGGIALALGGLAVLFLVIPATTRTGSWTGLSPYFFPTVAMVGFTVCSLFLILQSLLRPGLYTQQPKPLRAGELRNLAILAVLIVSAVALIHAAGLLIGGPPLIAAVMLFMGERRWRRLVLIPIVPVAVAYVFIRYLLQAPVP